MLELRHLRSFVAVAEELNFGRAAERLYITQPALSRQIRSLEQSLGCELFERSTRHVALTLAGEELLERARPLLREADEAVVAVQSIGGEIMARVARLWEPVGNELADSTDLQGPRAAFEEMLANSEVPAGIGVRAVNADGVPALSVGADPAAEPRVLYMHGGSLVLGSAFGFRSFAGAFAASCNQVVLVPDYRLAPEHPYPAAIDDVCAAYKWMLGRGATPGEVFLAADSTGCGLLLSLLLRLRDEEAPMPAAAVLFSPVADLDLSASGGDQDQPADRMFGRFWRGCVEAYLNGHSAEDPDASPAGADLRSLPPLLIQTGTEDPLSGEARALQERAQEFDVDAELELFPTDAHGFQLFWSFMPEAADAVDAAGAFISGRAPAAV